MSKLSRFVTIPFKDGGRDFNGVDCWGLTMLVFREFGICLPDFRVSCRHSVMIDQEFSINKDSGKWLRVEVPTSPCAVAFRMSNRYLKLVNHIGTCIGSGKFIHIMEKTGVSIVSLSHPFFSQKIEGFYEYRF